MTRICKATFALKVSSLHGKIMFCLVHFPGGRYVLRHPSTYNQSLQIIKEALMNKTDLINQVASIVGTQKQAKDTVDCVLDSITDALAKNESVQISGFGSFKVSERKARTGRNPQTGAPIQIPAGKVPKFVPGKALKEAVK
jgi:nucleoid DNA-binding protein